MRLVALNLIRHPRDLFHFRDIVDADNVRSAQDRCRYGRSGTKQSLADSHGWLALARHRFPEERFPRWPDQDRAAQPGKFGELRQNFEILFVCFSESDSGIENQL